jgi:hypothetical protein
VHVTGNTSTSLFKNVGRLKIIDCSEADFEFYCNTLQAFCCSQREICMGKRCLLDGSAAGVGRSSAVVNLLVGTVDSDPARFTK